MDEDLSWIVIKIKNMSNKKIVHTQPKLDRCCKSSGWDQDVNELKFEAKDNIPRISCDVTKNYFFERYVRRRVPVILTNCTDSWKAKHWSFEGMIQINSLICDKILEICCI